MVVAIVPTVCNGTSTECYPTPAYVFSSREEAFPWLEIRLGSLKKVRSVNVMAVDDPCCTGHLANLEVRAGLDIVQEQFTGQQLDKNQVCGSHDGQVGQGETIKILCREDIRALYVQIQRLESGRLSLSEITVNIGNGVIVIISGAIFGMQFYLTFSRVKNHIVHG